MIMLKAVRARLLLIFLVVIIATPNAISQKKKSGRTAYYAEMKKGVESLNKLYPVMNDDGTITDHIAFENNTLIVFYKCDKGMLDEMKKNGINESLFLKTALDEMAANLFSANMQDAHLYNQIKKYKTSLLYKYGYIGEKNYFYQKKYSFDEWLSLYNSRVLTKAPSAHYSLAFYKEIIEMLRTSLPHYYNDTLEKHDMNFIGDDLCVDWFIDESLAYEEVFKDISTIALENFYDMHEFDMENGLKAYKIKIHNRFYSKTSKKLLRDYTILQ